MSQNQTILAITLTILFTIIVLSPLGRWYFTVLSELVRLTFQLLKHRFNSEEDKTNGHDNL